MEMKNNEEDQKPSFWKKRLRPVPGWPSPKKELFKSQNGTSSSFYDFNESVKDVWDVKDDITKDVPKTYNVKISKAMAFSTASRVIKNHRTKASTSSNNSDSGFTSKNLIESKIDRLVGCNDYDVVNCNSIINRSANTNRSSSVLKAAHVVGIDNVVGKLEKFQILLDSKFLSIDKLRNLSWSGVPVEVRPIVWRLLSGYLPVNQERRQAVLQRKRLDYWNLVKHHFVDNRDETYEDILRQISIDIPRMNPLNSHFQQKRVQEMFERVLFIWALRHPASGYVQGMNDLLTPFYVVFLQEFIPLNEDIETLNLDNVTKEHQDIIEADSFWCFSKFLDALQENYIFAQLGIQQKVNQLRELIQRVDCTLHMNLTKHGIDYLQFSYRWMNNLLTRELPLCCSVRLWDTYLAESESFASFQVYVCAAFLLHWRKEILVEQDFQGLMLLIQKLPTQKWTDSDIDVLVAEAFQLKFTFADAPNHLQTSKN